MPELAYHGLNSLKLKPTFFGRKLGFPHFLAQNQVFNKDGCNGIWLLTLTVLCHKYLNTFLIEA